MLSKTQRMMCREVVLLKRRHLEHRIFMRKIMGAINLCVERGDADTLSKIQSQFPDLGVICNSARRMIYYGR